MQSVASDLGTVAAVEKKIVRWTMAHTKFIGFSACSKLEHV